MAMDLDSFKNRVAGPKNLARPNLFYIRINLDLAKGDDDDASTLTSLLTGRSDFVSKEIEDFQTDFDTMAKDIPFLAKASSIPSDTIGSIDVPYMGRSIKSVGNRVHDTWSITILNDEGYTIRKLLSTWQKACCSNGKYSLMDNRIRATLKVVQLGQDLKPTFAVFLNGAYPTEIGSIELGWDTNDAIEEYTVSFAYNWHEEKHDKTTLSNLEIKDD
jgi:hypothetical protein